MEAGDVYIFSNEAFPKNLLKVGMTALTARERARQISRHEGVPKEYKEVWSRKVPNIALAEKALHYFLHKYAYNKEFFKLAPELAIGICTEAMNRVFAPLDEKKLKAEAAAAKERERNAVSPLELARLRALRVKAIALSERLKLFESRDEIAEYAKEEKNKMSFVPVGVQETNWESIADSLTYKFGREAIRLILKEKKKGDSLRKRFICYRTGYAGCEAIHVFFTKKHISLYLKSRKSTAVRKSLMAHFGDMKKMELKPVAEGLSFKVKTGQEFEVLKRFLKMGNKNTGSKPE